MTDEEIDKRVFEIEGWELINGCYISTNGGQQYGIPPYTTGWTWCGPLIEKYRIELWTNEDRSWVAHDFMTQGKKAKVKDDTPQRAVCLAVISLEGE